MRELFALSERRGIRIEGPTEIEEDRRKMQKMQEFRKSQTDKYMNVLSAEQKAKWKQLIGEEFKGKIEFRGFAKPRQP